MRIPKSTNSSANPSGIWERVELGNGHIPVNWGRLDLCTWEPKAWASYKTTWSSCLKLVQSDIRQLKRGNKGVSSSQGMNLLQGLCIRFYYHAQNRNEKGQDTHKYSACIRIRMLEKLRGQQTNLSIRGDCNAWRSGVYSHVTLFEWHSNNLHFETWLLLSHWRNTASLCCLIDPVNIILSHVIRRLQNLSKEMTRTRSHAISLNHSNDSIKYLVAGNSQQQQ